MEPRRGTTGVVSRTQGARRSAATLGYSIEPFQGSPMASSATPSDAYGTDLNTDPIEQSLPCYEATNHTSPAERATSKLARQANPDETLKLKTL